MLNKLIVGMLLVVASSAACADQKVFDMKGMEDRTASRAQSGTETAPESPAAAIAEGDMSLETLERLFKSAYFKISVVGEDTLSVQMSADLSAKIHIDRQHKLLFFYKVYGFKSQADQAKRVDLANRINDSAILVRASVPDDHSDSLVLDYYLPYEDSVLAFQVVNGLRRFSEVANKAVIQFDSGDIVE